MKDQMTHAEAVGKIAEMAEEIGDLLRSVEFYKHRCNLLQRWQSRMRDPERTIVCDILANGQMLPDASGERYGGIT